MGGTTVKQEKGTPIGGPGSSAFLHAVLSGCEFDVDTTCWREALGHRVHNDPRERHIAAFRYVDDCGLASRTICETCLARFLLIVFSDVVEFDVEEKHILHIGETVSNKFLDMMIIIDFFSCKFSLFNPNISFFRGGCVGTLAKVRFPPAIGRSADFVRRLGMNLASRRARWKQLRLPRSGCSQAFVLDCLELWVLGYSANEVYKAVTGVRSHDWHVLLCVDVIDAMRPVWLSPSQQAACFQPCLSEDAVTAARTIMGIHFDDCSW